MARDMLIAQPASTTGQWVRLEPPGKRIHPLRIVVIGTFAGEFVYIEELVGGLPTSPAPLQGNPGLLTAGVQTGTVQALGSIGAGGGDLIIDDPVEFIRARTGAFSSGTASAYLEESA